MHSRDMHTRVGYILSVSPCARRSAPYSKHEPCYVITVDLPSFSVGELLTPLPLHLRMWEKKLSAFALFYKQTNQQFLRNTA